MISKKKQGENMSDNTRITLPKKVIKLIPHELKMPVVTSWQSAKKKKYLKKPAVLTMTLFLQHWKKARFLLWCRLLYHPLDHVPIRLFFSKSKSHLLSVNVLGHLTFVPNLFLPVINGLEVIIWHFVTKPLLLIACQFM